MNCKIIRNIPKVKLLVFSIRELVEIGPSSIVVSKNWEPKGINDMKAIKLSIRYAANLSTFPPRVKTCYSWFNLFITL